MLANWYYSLFLVMGVLYSDIIFKEKSIYFKMWAGGIIGNVALMFGIIPLALMFGFNRTSHILLAVIFTAPYAVMGKKPSLDIKKPYPYAAFAVCSVAFVICALFENHIMLPVPGGIATGQSTYGDLAMHMGFITSIAQRGKFPPEFNLLSGTRLCYPFLIDSLSASMCVLGGSLRKSLLYPGFVFAFLTTSGFYFLAEKLTKNKKSAVLATVIFFLGGGFGFSYFMDGAKANIGIFTRLFTEYYKTPTNFNEHNIRWANSVCDMIVPQRTTMAGWCVLFFAMWLLLDAKEAKKRGEYALLGIIAGAMPMIHTHSFLALGIISAVLFFEFLGDEQNKKEYVLNWSIYGAAALGLALPQLWYWTFSQSVGNEQFLRLSFNWVNHDDPYLWFWLKNWGMTAIFLIPAFFGVNKFQKKTALGAAAVFVLAEFVIFQPNEYDNNKLFFVSYAIFVIITADYARVLYERLKGIGGVRTLAALLMFFSLISGVLTITREYKSGGDYITFSESDMAFADFVRENTEKDAVFACGDDHLNPVCVLAGRTIFVGSPLYVYYHGYSEEMNKRNAQIEKMYKSRSVDGILETAKENNIRYIVLTEYERQKYAPDENVFAELKKIYDKDGNLLYLAQKNKK